jgi:uncharacterized SAM-binding protein YcdF (DUF218 family)
MLSAFSGQAGRMFWLKKFFSPFLLPLQFVLVCGVLGAVLLGSRRWRRTGRVLLTLAVLVLLAASNKWVSGRLIAPLESRYPAVGDFQPGHPLPARLAACRYVVVLGGGHEDGDVRPALSRLSTSARARLTEGMRLLRLLPAAKLVVSGPSDNGGPTHAQILADSAVSLGVERTRILMIDDARDTEEEAARLRALAGDAPVAVVTSAWHLPRAMALCAAQGLHALPCPTDYLYCAPPRWRLSDFTWDVPSLERSTTAVHERLGLWWSRLRRRA